ncbi:hypothetical protein D3C73_1089310 [compost metagenome]
MRQSGQIRHHHIAHLRIQMHGVDDLQIFAARELGQRRTDVLEPVAKALAPMAGHQQQPPAGVQPAVAGFQLTRERSRGIQLGAGHRQCIDHGIAGDGDPPRQVLARQIAARLRGRSEQPVTDRVDHTPVHFFGEGHRQVAGTQAGLDVPDPHAPVKRRQCAGRRGAGIAMHQYAVGLFGFQNLVHAGNEPRVQAVQGLVRHHDVQIMLGAQSKQRQHLIQHFAMLAGDAHHVLNRRLLGKGGDERRHLDRFGTGPKDG